MSQLSPAEAETLARIHARSFTNPRPWTAAEFQLMASSPNHLLLGDPDVSLAVVQLVLDEAELLTIAVDPDKRRHGIGGKLMRRVLEAAAARGATRMFLDVAADNLAAIALYRSHGFAEIGRRKNYYRHGDHSVDALLMERALGAL